MTDGKIRDYFSGRGEEFVRDLTELVAVDSAGGDAAPGAPYGPGPRKALDAGAALARRFGFEPEIFGDRVCIAEYGPGKARLGVLAHLDVVPAGGAWTETEPFKCALKNGVLYGRGVADDKGPALAALYALRAVKELGFPLSHKVQLILGSNEERGSGDIAWYMERRAMPPMVFSPDADYPVVNTEKGRMELAVTGPGGGAPSGARIESLAGGQVVNAVPQSARAVLSGIGADAVRAAAGACAEKTGASFRVLPAEDGAELVCTGRASHGAQPEKGVNAVCALLECVLSLPLAECAGVSALRGVRDAIPFGDWAGRAFGAACSDPESGPLTVNLGVLSYCAEKGLSAGIDLRTPVGADGRDIFAALVRKLGASGAAASIRTIQPPHHTPADSELVRTLLGVYEDYTGRREKPIAMGGLTYVHEIEGGVAFGCEFPGRTPRMHEPDENVRLDDLLLSAEMFTQAIARICG